MKTTSSLAIFCVALLLTGCGGQQNTAQQEDPVLEYTYCEDTDLINDCIDGGVINFDGNIPSKFRSLDEGYIKEIIRQSPLFEREGISDNQIILNPSDETIEITKNNCEGKSKVIDVILDVTYFNQEDEDIETYIRENRLNKLFSYLEGREGDDHQLNQGDQVRVRFLGTKGFDDEGGFDDVLDASPLVIDYGTSCEESGGLYELKQEYKVDYYNKSKYNVFYNIAASEGNKEVEVATINTIDEVKDLITDEFNKYYGEYSKGTYLLSFIHKNEIFFEDADMGDIVIFLSDFLFQLHPNTLKEIEKTVRRDKQELPDGSLNFSRENIDKYFGEDQYSLARPALYEYYLVGEDGYSGLKSFDWIGDLCKGYDNTIIFEGIGNLNDIALQSKMEDYFSEKLFRNCNLQF